MKVSRLNRNQFVTTLILLVVAIVSGCGTVASFKTAKLTDARSPEVTIGASFHDVPFQNKSYSDDVYFTSTVRPDFGVWARLGGEKSPYDLGLNFSAPVPNGLQITARRNISPGKGSTPEITVGVQFRKYENEFVGQKNIYNSYYRDFAFPIYFDWTLPLSFSADVYTNLTPFTREFQFAAGPTTNSAATSTELVFGAQITLGIKLGGFFLEYNAVPMTNGFMQTQAGIAYVF